MSSTTRSAAPTRSPRCAASRFLGRYLVVGFASGEIPKIPLNLLLLKQASLVGVFWGAYAKARPEENAGNFAELFDWYAQGRLHPHVSAELSARALSRGAGYGDEPPCPG